MCLNCATRINVEAKDAFGRRMLGMVNEAAMALMVSIGHRTGLFDRMAEMEPATSSQIAEATGLNERYVREWLGAMTTGRIVEHDADLGTYHLPAEHAAMLTRSAVPENMAGMMQWFGILGSVESDIVDCFRKGGGLTYDRYPRFHSAMAEESYQTTVSGLRQHILPMAEGLIEQLHEGIDVLDIGCGSGWAMIELAGMFPNSRFVGYDLCEDAIESARARAAEADVTNVTFAVRDVSKLTEADRFDLITAFDAIHDQARPDAVLANIRRALKDNGLFLMQDIGGSSSHAEDMDRPLAPFTYTISCMHCMSVSLGQGGMGLGAAWGRKVAMRMLDEAGFGQADVHQLPHDFMNDYYLIRKN